MPKVAERIYIPNPKLVFWIRALWFLYHAKTNRIALISMPKKRNDKENAAYSCRIIPTIKLSMELTKVLADIEMNGIYVDKNKLSEIKTKFETKI